MFLFISSTDHIFHLWNFNFSKIGNIFAYFQLWKNNFIYLEIDVIIGDSMNRQQLRKMLLFTSFFLFPLSYFFFSPYLIIWGASEGIINGSFIVFSLLFFSSLFLGRAFCGWICPAGGFQEIVYSGYDKKFTNGRKKISKFLIWIPWVSIIIMTAIASGGYKSINPLFQMIGTQNMSGDEIMYYFSLYYIVLGIILLLNIILGRRGFCHTGCWMAPFMIIGNKIRETLPFPGLHIKSNEENCIGCTRCNKVCPMGLEVMDMAKSGGIVNSDCILCLQCVDICKKDVLHTSFGFPMNLPVINNNPINVEL